MIEELAPLFLESDFQIKTAPLRGQKVYRVNVGAGRHYRLEDGRTFKSLTTFLDAILPASKILEDWKGLMVEELGTVDKMRAFVQATADYGTGLHIAVAEYCRQKGVTWAKFDQWAFEYLGTMGIKPETVASAQGELTRDFAALLQFIHDYEVEIIAVEIPVWIDEGAATLIDIVCKMNAKLYTEKTPPEKRQRHKALINLKSGKKGFFENHVFQLEGERRMFNHVYGPSVGMIEQVYNLAPNNWHKAPTYKLKNQTEAIADGKIDKQFTALLTLAELRGVLSTPKREFTVFMGETKFGENPSEAMAVLSYDEYADRKISEYAPVPVVLEDAPEELEIPDDIWTPLNPEIFVYKDQNP